MINRLLILATTASVLALSPVTVQAQSFDEWREAFAEKATNYGLPRDFVRAQLRGINPDPVVTKLDGKQPEFYKSPGAYVQSATNQGRVTAGRQVARDHANLLQRIERNTGVPAEIVVAIFGVETAYGQITGSQRVVRSLATLAHDGRRQTWAERELMQALKMVARGDVQPHFKGSWAGAFGLTQFMPTSVQRYGVDGDGNGRVNMFTHADALSSTGYYLSRHGWRSDQPWMAEVTLPRTFDLMQTDGRTKPLQDWVKSGVSLSNGDSWQASHLDLQAKVLLPTGRNGPAFVTFPNFEVIKRYNNSTSYAMAVSHLANRVAGGADMSRDWPEVKLTTVAVERIQARLKAAGYLDGKVDGRFGPQTQGAVRKFQQANGLAPDGFLDAKTLAVIKVATR